MNILILSHEMPSITVGGTVPTIHLINYLSSYNENKIFLVSFISAEKNNSNNKLNFSDRVIVEEPIKIPKYTSTLMQMIYTTKNMLYLDNLLSNTKSIFNFYYHPAMSAKIENILNKYNFDIIITDAPMSFYVQNIKLPKVLMALDAISHSYHQRFNNAKNIVSKLLWYLQYQKFVSYEQNVYPKFDLCSVVTQKDRNILLSIVPRLHINVIPYGVDSIHFKPMPDKDNDSSLIFVGDMSTPSNIESVLYFYNMMYPHIKAKISSIKLYIVGRNPSNNILKLSEDKSVIVTGYVEDVRSYIANSSVVIAPMVSGTGIKNKILEGMSMAKPVVTTSIGAEGIALTNGINGIIENEPDRLVEAIIQLLSDNDKRHEMGSNARLLIEEKYSWKYSFDELYSIILKLSRDNHA